MFRSGAFQTLWQDGWRPSVQVETEGEVPDKYDRLLSNAKGKLIMNQNNDQD